MSTMQGDEKSEKFRESSTMQKTMGVAAIISAFAGMILIIAWMKGSNTADGYMSGLNFKELIFNYHPIFMSLGMILCGITSVLSYRILPFPKWITKSIHGWLHTFAVVFVVIGLTCVIVGNNHPDYNTGTGNTYYANFFSLHSFIGLGAIYFFVKNYFVGAWYFLTSTETVSPAARRSYLPTHMFLGSLGVSLAIIAALTGIMELVTELQPGGYTVTSVDINPAKNYHLLLAGVRVANGAGVLYLLALVCFLAALYPFSKVNGSDKERLLSMNLNDSGQDPQTL